MEMETPNPITLEWIKIKTANAQDTRAAIAEVERFTGETGELVHFLKAGDRIHKAIAEKEAAGWLDAGEVPALKAALANRVSRHVLNFVQSDEDTQWDVLKARLKKAYGGGRWAPEEDVWRMFREVKGPRQSAGSYAAKLLGWHATITEKLGEQGTPDDTQIKMKFLEDVLKVQLRRETARSLAADKPFTELAKELVDEDAREVEEEKREREARWTEVRPRRFVRPEASPRNRDYRERRREPREYPRPRRDARGEAGDRKRCFECGSSKHLAARCEKRRCFGCGTEGHVARNCPYMKQRSTSRPEPMEINTQELIRRQPRYERTDRESSETTDSGEESDHTAESAWTRRSNGRKGAKAGKSTAV